MKANVAWGASGSNRAEIGSVEELDLLIDHLEQSAQRPLILDLVIPGTGSLSMGVGREETVLSFVPESQDPPYFHSVGPIEDGEDLIFYYYDQWTDFPHRQAIPISQGREVLRRFLTERTLPDVIQWEET